MQINSNSHSIIHQVGVQQNTPKGAEGAKSVKDEVSFTFNTSDQPEKVLLEDIDR